MSNSLYAISAVFASVSGNATVCSVDALVPNQAFSWTLKSPSHFASSAVTPGLMPWNAPASIDFKPVLLSTTSDIVRPLTSLTLSSVSDPPAGWKGVRQCVQAASDASAVFVMAEIPFGQPNAE